jgi:tetratricopeptide (TPR) repeat protein
MNDIARQKLKELISRFGTSLATDRMRCLGMMRDMCREQKKEISGIMTALEEGIPTAIMKPDFSIEITRKLLILKLENDRGLAKEVAVWSVDTWAIALGVLTEAQLLAIAQCAPVPSPQPPSVVHNSAPSRSSVNVNLNQPRPSPSPNNSGVPSSQNQFTSRGGLFFVGLIIVFGIGAVAIGASLRFQHKTKLETERKLQEEVQRKAKLETERKLQEEVQRKAKLEADRKLQEEKQRKAKLEADRKLQEEKQRKAKLEADRKLQEEKQRKAKLEADRKLQDEKQRTAKLEAENQRIIAKVEARDRGKAKRNVGDYQGAIEAYTQAIRIDPKYADAYLGRGAAKHSLGDKQAAIEDFTQAININPKLQGAYEIRGFTKAETGDYRGAVADFNQAIKINPKGNLFAYRGRGLAKAALSDYQGALADLSQDIKSNPRDAEAYKTRGGLKEALGDKNGAIADLQMSAELYKKQGNNSSYNATIERINKLKI